MHLAASKQAPQQYHGSAILCCHRVRVVHLAHTMLEVEPSEPLNSNIWMPLVLEYTAGSGLFLSINGTVYCEELPLANWSPIPGSNFGFGARSGVCALLLS